MNRRTVTALVVNDLRQLARNPRVLVFAVALPLVLWPLMWFLTSLTTERRQERIESRTYIYAVADETANVAGGRRRAGMARAGAGRRWRRRPGRRRRTDRRSSGSLRAASKSRTMSRPALDEERLHVHVAWETGRGEDLPDEDVDRETVGNAGESAPPHRPRLTVEISTPSDSAEGFLRRALQRTRTEVREQRLAAAGFDTKPEDLLPLERIETASEEQTCRAPPGPRSDRDHRDDDARGRLDRRHGRRWPAKRNAARSKPC